MKYIFFIVLCFPLFLFAAPPIEDLPWISIVDSEAINLAGPYLPENPVIIEAGVCDAEDTLRMKKKWPNAKIHGFEPLPEFYERAQKETYSLQNVFLYPFALFDYVGQITFYRSSKIPGASSVLQDNIDNIDIPADIKHNGVNYQDIPITVNCLTLDYWAQKNGISNVDYIWLDTEGAELPILKNAVGLLKDVKVLTTEVNFKEFRQGMTQFPELYDFLQEQGFTLKYIWGRSDWQGVAIFLNAKFCDD